MTDPNITAVPDAGATNVHVHVAPQDSAMAVASLILGIFAICTVWIPVVGLIAWILAPVGLILGILALNRSTGSGKGVAIAGIVCSTIGLLGCIGWVVLIGMAASVGVGA
ncbi:hypothetical protein [Brevundimonas sp.]|uniref:hypothetical protein n=1 Tax=Brevundimonas sp. TaxID=1871086 RepID=UPI002FC83E67